MSDFLLELRCEEIPARMQAGARVDLERLFRKEMDAAGVALGEVTVWSTPRRLALIARGLPEETQPVTVEKRGPRIGAPSQALEGFARSSGTRVANLTQRDGFWWDSVDTPGLATLALLSQAIPDIVRAFPWPKSMRWGAASLSSESLRWVRPLSSIVAIFGEDLVECEVGGIRSGFATHGHRFHCPGEITIGSAHDYAEKLRACHVIVDHEERQDLIRNGAARAAAEAGLTLIEDEGLVIENAGLTEWPVPLLGRFDEAFLDVPPEVIQLTARTNQKYFVCTRAPAQAGASGQVAQPHAVPAFAGTLPLANAFVCTANVVASDGGAEIVAGNRKVLAARLSDARFFWEQDRKVPLAEQARKLERITFHEKLGTVADKVERVAKLARWLVEEAIVRPREGGDLGQQGATSPEVPAFAGTRAELADQAELAARLCKADLVTEMVGEFPELQGLMGGYYARAEGLPDAVADAIRDHYKPVGQGDDVPTAPVTVAVSLADKLDTLVGFFYHRMPPTGSKDPFALRRAGLSAIALITSNGLRVCMLDVLVKLMIDLLWESARDEHVGRMREVIRAKSVLNHDDLTILQDFRDVYVPGAAEFAWLQADARLDARTVLEFLADRLKVQQREAGVRHDLIDAVFALGGEDDLVRLLARVHALQAFVGTADGTNLLAGYKRAANILKKEGYASPLPGWEGAIGGTGLQSRVGVPPIDRAPNPHPPKVTVGTVGPSPAGKGLEEIALSYTPEPAEKALIDALDAAGPKATAAVAAEDFAGAMAALATLRAPIDAFFEEVTVNDADPAKRQYRLSLLARLRDAVHGVADFSRIEG